MRGRKVIAEVVCGLSASVALFGGAGDAYADVSGGLYAGSHAMPGLLKVTGSLLLVLAVLLGVVVFAKKFPLSRVASRGAARTISVLDRFYLTPKLGLFLVRVGPRVLLLGVGPEEVRLIAELQEGELTTHAHEPQPAFSDQLERFLSHLTTRRKEKSGALS